MSLIIHNPKHVDLEIANNHTQVEGRFGFKKYNARTGELVQSLDAVHNLITNAGLVMAGTTWEPHIFVGTGNLPPSVTQVTLQSFRQWTKTISTVWATASARSPTPGEWVEGRGTWRFIAGSATGNLTEVGFGRIIKQSPLEYELFSRALIVDESGMPVTITINDDEYLDVVYTLRSYTNPEDVTSEFIISGTTHSVVTRMAGANTSGTDPSNASMIDSRVGVANSADTYAFAYGTPTAGGVLAFNGDVNASTTTPFVSFSRGVSSLSAVTTQNPASFGASSKITVDLSSSNFDGGIKGFTYRRGGTLNVGGRKGINDSAYRAIVTPPIMKDATKILTFNMDWTWGRKP